VDDARLTEAARITYLACAGDQLAEILGCTVARLESDEDFTPDQYEAVRGAILIWHRLSRQLGP
jgi:hypothetical protein